MIIAILICISLGCLTVTWFLYKRNLELFLCLLIAVSSEFFYLLPQFVGYKYLLLPMLPMLLIAELLQGRLSMGRYGWQVLAFMGIALFGIVVAMFNGQSIDLGIKAAKFIPLCLVYFLLAGRQINISRFAAYFVCMALAVSLPAALLSFTHGSVNLFPGLPPEMLMEQTGRLRITAGQYVISAATVVAFAAFQKGKGILFLPAFAALLAEVILVQQTRGFIFATLLSIFVIYTLSHKLTPVRLSIYLMITGCCLMASLAVSFADLGKIGFISRTQSDLAKKSGSYGGSVQARLNAYEYYWEQIQKAPITGRGMVNFNWEGNLDSKLQRVYHIHLSDVGVIHFLVQAGLVGFIWLSALLFILWKDTLVLRGHLIVTSYFIIGTFTLPTLDMFFRSDSLFLFAVFLGLSASMIMAERAKTKDPERIDAWTSPS